MATIDTDKENVAPFITNDHLLRKNASPSPKKAGRKGRSKSIGPGALDEEIETSSRAMKERRKSAFLPATRSILSKNEDMERAARRKTMVNRRVSFAPEATLHTWDVIELGRDQTTSTDSPESTRRNSNSTRSPTPSSDGEESVTSPGEEDAERPATRKTRRSSGIPPMNFNNPDDIFSSGGIGNSSEESGSEQDEEEKVENSGDDSSTAMSLDVEENTLRSVAESDGSTGSSARLEAALKLAAHTAGTRGIEYDEYGDMSMEMAGDEITNAFQPWAQRNAAEAPESAAMDQENVNPFSSAFKLQSPATRPQPIEEAEDEDVSMDVTRAVGGIKKPNPVKPDSSPLGEATMDLTRPVGKITGQKRRHSTAETGSPAAGNAGVQSKRTRSSISRTSVGDDTGEQTNGSPVKVDRRRSIRQRRSSGVTSEVDDATMEFTRAVGSIKPNQAADNSSIEEHEELSMELTTVMGGAESLAQPSPAKSDRHITPPTSNSPAELGANRTPKHQERFKDTPDLSAKKLLTPVLLEQAENSAEKKSSTSRSLNSSLRGRRATIGPVSTPDQETSSNSQDARGSTGNLQQSLENSVPGYPELPPLEKVSPAVQTPVQSPKRGLSKKTPNSELKEQLEAQLDAPEPSPSAGREKHSSPVTSKTTPERSRPHDETITLADSIKLMSTPRKETLRNVSPKKQTPAKSNNPMKTTTPRSQRVLNARAGIDLSPARELKEDIASIQANGNPTPKIGLQDFLTNAGIRFMDLTTTKRRLTTAPTPSKVKKAADSPNKNIAVDESDEVTLESSVVAAACTIPELDLYQHACHELKRYTREGKQMVSELEAETLKETPPLIQAYVQASGERKTALDAQMRDIKTNARFQSKEMWYAWRSKLLDELMVGFQRIGEGLIKDDEPLGQAERVLDQILPDLEQRHTTLQGEAKHLRETVTILSEEEKEELQSARQNLNQINAQLNEKRRLLEELRRKTQEQDDLASNIQESQLEYTAAIQEAARVRNACRGVSIEEIATLKGS